MIDQYEISGRLTCCWKRDLSQMGRKKVVIHVYTKSDPVKKKKKQKRKAMVLKDLFGDASHLSSARNPENMIPLRVLIS